MVHEYYYDKHDGRAIGASSPFRAPYLDVGKLRGGWCTNALTNSRE